MSREVAKRTDLIVAEKHQTLMVGQMGVSIDNGSLQTTLGSCVGIALVDPRTKTIGLAHILLPESPAAECRPEFFGRYADTAIPTLIQQMGLMLPSLAKGRLKAYLSGGANTFLNVISEKSLLVGALNIEKVESMLKELGIEVIAKDVGGERGRIIVMRANDLSVWSGVIGSDLTKLS